MTDYSYLTYLVSQQGREGTARAFENAARWRDAGHRFLPTAAPNYELRLVASRVRLGLYDPPGHRHRQRRMRIEGPSLDAVCRVGHYLRRTVDCAVVHESEGAIQGERGAFHLDVFLSTTSGTDLTLFEVLPPVFRAQD